MKQKYTSVRFGSKALAMIETVNTILAEYAADGYDLSLRQLYYQLVSRNIVPNSEKSYKNTGSLVSDGRLAGLIDWDIIKDRGRTMVSLSHWHSPADIVRACASQYRVDRWINQPCYVEVMVEKQALEGVLIPVCQEWDVPFTANKGYSSSSAMREAGLRLMAHASAGQEAHVIYLGDHDPSGIDMTRDVRERLEMFAENNVEVARVALNMPQIEELNPPENPAKMSDSRAKDYVAEFGSSSWELDAIEPKALAALVSDAIKGLIDWDQWAESGKEQARGRSTLTGIARTMEKDA